MSKNISRSFVEARHAEIDAAEKSRLAKIAAEEAADEEALAVFDPLIKDFNRAGFLPRIGLGNDDCNNWAAPVAGMCRPSNNGDRTRWGHLAAYRGVHRDDAGTRMRPPAVYIRPINLEGADLVSPEMATKLKPYTTRPDLWANAVMREGARSLSDVFSGSQFTGWWTCGFISVARGSVDERAFILGGWTAPHPSQADTRFPLSTRPEQLWERILKAIACSIIIPTDTTTKES